MILVTGGTGFVGSAVVRELLKRGETVAVLGRDAAKTRRVFAGSVEPREADVREAASLQQAISGADVVVDAVQFPTSPIEIPRRGWTFEEVDYKGSVNQIDAAKAVGVKRYVYVSGIGADPSAAKHWFRFKYMAEEHLRQSGLEWSIARPTWVYGPEDSSLNRLLAYTRLLPFMPFFGSGDQQMQPVFIDDVARVVADAALRPEAVNQLFELGGPDVMSMNELLKTAMDVAGRRRPILHQPIFFGKLIGAVAQMLPTPPLTPDAVDFLVAPAVADNTSLEQVLAPQLTPFRQGLETYLKKKT